MNDLVDYLVITPAEYFLLFEIVLLRPYYSKTWNMEHETMKRQVMM